MIPCRAALVIALAWPMIGLQFPASDFESILPYIQEGPNQPAALAVSPDGRWLVSANLDGVRLYDLFREREVRLLPEYNAKGLVFTPDGKTLITAGSSTAPTDPVQPSFSIRSWDLETGEPSLLFTGKKPDCSPSLQSIDAIALSRDGSTLAAACEEEVRLWSLSAGGEMYSLPIHPSSAVKLAFSPDGITLAAGTYDGKLLLWNYRTRTSPQSLQAIKGNVTVLEFTPDGTMLAVGGRDGIQLRDARAPGEMTLPIILKDVYCATFSPDGKTLAIGSGLDIRTWDISSRAPPRTYGRFFGNVTSVVFSPDGRMLIGSGDRLIVWSTADGGEIHEFSRGAQPITFLALRQDIGALLAETATESKLWDYRTGRLKATVNGGVHFVMAGLGVRSDDGSLVAMRDTGTITVWDAKGGKPLYQFPGHNPITTDLAFRSDGKVLASGGADGMVRIWDLASEKNLLAIDTNEKRMLGPPGGFQVQDPATLFPKLINQLTFSEDGRLLAGVASNGSDANPIRIWDTLTGKEMKRLTGDGHFITALAFDPAHQRLADGTDAGRITIWNVSNGAQELSFQAHAGPITSLVFDTVRRTLVSGGWDGQIKIWDLDAAGRQLITMVATGQDDWLVFTPDGLFDGTAAAMREVGWRINRTNEVVPIESFYNDFFHPDLFGEISAGSRPRATTDIATMLQIPGLRTMLFQNSARIEDRAGRQTLCFDDKPTAAPLLFGDAQPEAFDPRQVTEFKEDGTCRYRVALSPGKQYELVDSRKLAPVAQVRLTYDGRASGVENSTVFVQTVAVGKYPQDSGFPPLPFSVSSAERIRSFFADENRRKQTPYARIQVENGLYDDEATQKGIRERLAEITQEMKEQDVLFLFFSGHGIVPPGQEMFFFAPWDIRGPDPELESETGFNTAMLADVVRDARPLRVFIVIDACQSGGALESLARVAQAKATDAAAMDKELPLNATQREIGIYIAASATPLQTAEQSTGLAGSPLVSTLVDGLRARNGSTVSARDLMDYIRSQTPSIATTVGTPMVVATGVDFPLALEK